MLGPRLCRISWPDLFMLQAIIASWRSPDPNTQVGAIIINNNNNIIGTGYNGFPRGIDVNSLPWDRNQEDPLNNKYAYVVHAEKNAIYNSTNIIENCTLYTTLFPCNECMKDIIQAGIKKITYLEDPYRDTWQNSASRTMAEKVGIHYSKHEWDLNTRLFLIDKDLLRLINV